ncbi:nucleoside-diphosphate kinase, partial [Candidatus Beckwithbacteria bacterium CG_4_10_14_0_2_um_filter_47_25]
MKSQQSVVLVKPDALQRGLLGEIIHRFERKGIKLIGLKMMRLTDEVLDQWY